MIRFFRHIRKKLMEQNKIRTYILYVIGEILLVVIGILIALQINNWTETQKNNVREQIHLFNLRIDLQADSSGLARLNADLQQALYAKIKFEESVEFQNFGSDSLVKYFKDQYFILTDFIPNSTTIDELKNSSGLNLISNSKLRRQIVSLYNTYEDLKMKLRLGTEKTQLILRYSSDKMDDINNPTDNEISDLLRDSFFINQTRINYLGTQALAINEAYKLNREVLQLISKEI